MASLFSRACEYGLQATLLIASKEGRRVGIREAAAELAIPPHFLAKILQSLSEQGVLASYKGMRGGYTLGRDAGSIRLLDVVAAIDGLGFFTTCIIGFPGCDSDRPCPVHERWGGMREAIHEMLSEDSISDLLPLARTKILSLAARADHTMRKAGTASGSSSKTKSRRARTP
jgi:Rrf2 family transcriptional regulator, iron-sulfur cluster assembly transcription factor